MGRKIKNFRVRLAILQFSDRMVLVKKRLGWEGQVYFVGICIFAKIIERKKGYY